MTAPSIIKGIPLSDEQHIGPLTLAAYLREVAGRWGPNEALVFHEPAGTTRWTYDELYAQALAVAKALVACRLGKQARVGVMMTNRPEWLAATFGAAMAGCVPVGISTFSTPAELAYLLQQSCASVLLYERHVVKKDFADVLTDIIPEIAKTTPAHVDSLDFPFLRHVVELDPAGAKDVGGETRAAVEGWATWLKRGEPCLTAMVEAHAATVQPSDPGLLFFSSGSTNKPKGILNANRGVCLQLWRWPRYYDIIDRAAEGRPLTRVWSANGLFWSGNFAQALGGALSTGGCLVLQATFQPEEAMHLMDIEKVNMAIAWPHQWKQLEGAANFASVDVSSLYWVNKDCALGRHPTVSTDWEEPMAAYGNTETFTISSIFPANTPVERIAGSHGEPSPGNIFKIVDPMTGETVPMGERGEIAVKGPTLMLGYIGVPLDETLDENGFFPTGDGGYVDETNRLFWEGRLSDIIKTGGANVSPLEIDDTIRSFPGVKITQTVGVPHEDLGELVVACVVAHEGVMLDAGTLRDYVKERLASYKVPRKFLFFTEAEVNLTGSNKIKSADLRVLAAKRLAEEA